MHQAGAEEENARPHRTPSDSARRVTASGCSPYGSHTASGVIPYKRAASMAPRESPAWHPVPCHPRPTDQVEAQAFRRLADLQLAQRLLAGADHHVVHLQPAFLAVDADQQAAFVDLQVLHPAEHPYGVVPEVRAVYPAAGLAELRAGSAGLALEQPDLARRPRRSGFAEAAGLAVVEVHAPFREPFAERPRLAVAGRGDEEGGDVEADAAGADDGDPRAHRRAAQHVHVAEYGRSADAVDPGRRGWMPVATTTSSN